MTKRLTAQDLALLTDGVKLSNFPPEALKDIDKTLVSAGFEQGINAFDNPRDILAVADAFSGSTPPFQTASEGLLNIIRGVVRKP